MEYMLLQRGNWFIDVYSLTFHTESHYIVIYYSCITLLLLLTG